MAGLRLIMLVLSIFEMVLVDTIRSKGVPGFTTPAMSSQQFLMVSSPSEKKVVWATLHNMESKDGRAFALVDSGLDTPKGLAFDHNRGYLYVADSGAKKIFRYTVLADISGTRPILTTSGVRLTIVQGHAVEWLTVDEEGNLFYTAPDTNNINKITSEVMQRIAKGEFAASALQIVSEKTLEAQQIAVRALRKKAVGNSSNAKPTDPPPVLPQILSMYEASLNLHVSSPASVWAQGPDLYWTNQRGGKKAGTVVKGQVNPKSTSSQKGPAPFPATALTSVGEGAFGLAKTDKVMFFSRNGTSPKSGLVTGLLLGGSSIAMDFVTTLASPRGLVWDKDQTMYVADQAGGHVWSFPTGRMMNNAPLTRTVTMKGAYGLVLLSANDGAFTRNRVRTGGVADEEENMATKVAAESGLTPGSDINVEHTPSVAAAGFLETGATMFLDSSAKRGQTADINIVMMIASIVGMLALST